MLMLICTYSELPEKELLDVYAAACRSQREQAAFLEHLKTVFFAEHRACYALWKADGSVVSALRLEPYMDGMLIAGLETHPEKLRMGYATALLSAVCRDIGRAQAIPLYSHIHRKNRVSMRLHRNCGFTQYLDYGKLLDGTVSSMFVTMRYQ